jgi:hypothetical protein
MMTTNRQDDPAVFDEGCQAVATSRSRPCVRSVFTSGTSSRTAPVPDGADIEALKPRTATESPDPSREIRCASHSVTTTARSGLHAQHQRQRWSDCAIGQSAQEAVISALKQAGVALPYRTPVSYSLATTVLFLRRERTGMLQRSKSSFRPPGVRASRNSRRTTQAAKARRISTTYLSRIHQRRPAPLGQ